MRNAIGGTLRNRTLRPAASAVTSQNLKRDVASQFDRRRDPSREEVQIGIAAPRQITDRVLTRPV
jgi:hypothetical protein